MNALESMQNYPRIPGAGDFYDENMPAITEAIEKIDPMVKNLKGNELVAALHSMNDSVQNHIGFKNVTQCDKQQCSFCCHSEIFITQEEADYIKATGKYTIDQDRLAKQRAATNYNQLNFADKACIMLKDGRCQVYSSRPLLCRNHGASLGTDPEDCHQQNIKHGTVLVNEPRTILTEALGFYIPFKRMKTLQGLKNIADYNW